ncbi:MAG: FecR domain-containing protein [Planctomycetota bacterium]
MNGGDRVRERDIGRYLDGTLSATECELLQQRCVEDPVLLEDCVGQLRLDHALRAQLAGPERDRQARQRIVAALAGANVDDARGRIMQVVRQRVGASAKRRLHRRRKLWFPLALAAAAALVIALFLPTTVPAVRSLDVAVCSAVDGQATVLRDGSSLALGVGMSLRVGDELLTASGVTACWRYSDEATVVTMVGDTKLGVRQEAGGKRLDLAAGAITCSVARQASGQDLRVITTGATAVIKGTEFTMQCTGNWAKLSVVEGLVQFERRHGATELVGAGQSAETLSETQTVSLNLLRAPGFEGDVSAWRRVDWLGRSFDDNEKHGGSRALRLSPTVAKDADVYQDLKVEPGAQLHLSLWIRGQALDGQGAVVQAMWLRRQVGDGDSSIDTLGKHGVLVACQELGPFTGTFAWCERGMDVTAPSDARFLRVRVLTHTMRTSNPALWIDDIQLICR